MVAARAAVLGAGHFLPLANLVAELAERCSAGARLVMEAGAGTGYYIGRVLDRLPETCGVAIDLSKYAAKRAARAHHRLDAVVADIFTRLPIKDGSVDLALNVFAPRPARELFRVLHRNGRLIVAFAGREHMTGVRKPLGLLEVDPDKELRVSRALDPFFVEHERRLCAWEMELNHAAIAHLAGMGPSARHIPAATLAARVALLPATVQVTASVQVRVYGRR